MVVLLCRMQSTRDLLRLAVQACVFAACFCASNLINASSSGWRTLGGGICKCEALDTDIHFFACNGPYYGLSKE